LRGVALVDSGPPWLGRTPTGRWRGQLMRTRGAFLNTGLEEVMPALTGYLGATPVAGVPGPASP
jgi:hypothetical protein